MTTKDKIECIIAFIIIGTYCALVSVDKVDPATFAPIAMYVIKKFMDGVKS